MKKLFFALFFSFFIEASQKPVQMIKVTFPDDPNKSVDDPGKTEQAVQTDPSLEIRKDILEEFTTIKDQITDMQVMVPGGELDNFPLFNTSKIVFETLVELTKSVINQKIYRTDTAKILLLIKTIKEKFKDKIVIIKEKLKRPIEFEKAQQFFIDLYSFANAQHANIIVTRAVANVCYDIFDDETIRMLPDIEDKLLDPLDCISLKSSVSTNYVDLTYLDLRTLYRLKETFEQTSWIRNIPGYFQNNLDFSRNKLKKPFLKEIIETMDKIIPAISSDLKINLSNNSISNFEFIIKDPQTKEKYKDAQEYMNEITAKQKITQINLEKNPLDEETKKLCKEINERFSPNKAERIKKSLFGRQSLGFESTELVASLYFWHYLSSKTKQLLLYSVEKVIPTLSQKIPQNRVFNWPFTIMIYGGVLGLLIKYSGTITKKIHDPLYQNIINPLKKKFSTYSLTILFDE
jgi:hypothetical protein